MFESGLSATATMSPDADWCPDDDGAPDGWWLDLTVPEPWGEGPAVSDPEPMDRPGPDAPLCSLLTQPPGGLAACGLDEAMEQFADLSEDALVEVTATAQRVSAWASWVQLKAIGQLVQIRSAPSGMAAALPEGPDARVARDLSAALGRRSVIAEVALACGLSEYAMAQRVGTAMQLESRLPIAAGAMSRGELDWSRLQTVAQATVGVSDQVARAVEAAVLLPERSPEVTAPSLPGLRKALAEAVARLDPGAASNAERAVKDRRVVFTGVGDGMTEVWALLPAVPAREVELLLKRRAALARTPGDERTADQRRADVFLDLLTASCATDPVMHVPAAGHPGSDASESDAQPEPEPEREPKPDGEPYSPPADLFDVMTELAEDLLTDSRSGHAGAPRADSDSPIDPQQDPSPTTANSATPNSATPNSATPNSATPNSATPNSATPNSATPNSATPNSATPNGTGSATGSTDPQVVVTVPLETLLGLTETPGWLQGYGPLPAAMARDVAARGTWRCAVVDGVHGTLLGLGRATYRPDYRPGRPLSRHLTVRDQTCLFPGCHRAADACDDDHRRRWPDGPTCECNLAKLCGHHHRLKHEANFTVALCRHPDQPPGTLDWTTPTGRVFHRAPTRLPSAAGPLAEGRPGQGPASDDARLTANRPNWPVSTPPDPPPF
jgi:Domain of unknown function (DUF222)